MDDLILLIAISIHALRVEGDEANGGKRWCASHFYPRPPGGGRLKAGGTGLRSRNFYPRPPGGGRQPNNSRSGFAHIISIHALRVEGDRGTISSCAFAVDFYPRPPGGGRPCQHFEAVGRLGQFLSTPSGWRATVHIVRDVQLVDDISIHALRVEGDLALLVLVALHGISIHALRVEGDRQPMTASRLPSTFLSTPSGWRATCTSHRARTSRRNFYPRPPGGGRLRRASRCFLATSISIHALRVEGDRQEGQSLAGLLISIHALRVEGD